MTESISRPLSRITTALNEEQAKLAQLISERSRYQVKPGCSRVPWDDIILFYLEENGFNYNEVSSRVKRTLAEKNVEIAELTKKVDALKNQAEKQETIELIKRLDVSFEGPNVTGYDGSAVHLICLNCKTKFDGDASSLSDIGWKQFLAVTTQALLDQMKGMGSTEIHTMCPNQSCHQAITFIFDRKITGAPKP